MWWHRDAVLRRLGFDQGMKAAASPLDVSVISAARDRLHRMTPHKTLLVSTAVVLATSMSGCADGPGGSANDPPVDSMPASTSMQDAGGADAPLAPVHKTLFQVIDDMEASDPGDNFRNFVSPVGLGSWLFRGPPNAGSPALPVAVIAATDQPRERSLRAWRVPVPAGGAPVSLFLDLHGANFPAVPFADLSAYAGIAFWSRASLPLTELVVAVADSSSPRSDLYQAAQGRKPLSFARTVKLSSQWQRHVILFDDLVASDTSRTKLNTSALWAVNFIASSGSTSDYWIDDLALLCRGVCPPPPLAVEPSAAAGLDPASLQWTSGSAANSCGELASLTMDSLRKDVVVGEKILLHARVRGVADAEVPAWLWRGQNTRTGELAEWKKLDDGSSMAALSFPSTGSYTVGAHTHYPGIATCSVEVTINVVP